LSNSKNCTMRLTNLDMDVLRTLVTAQQLGSFNRTANHIGRSQSAVSQQIRKLEEQVGEPLFHKQGRHMVLTEAGEVMLAYARRILDLNDEAVAAIRGRAAEGLVRFGLPADFAETWLPAALGTFKRTHPAVRIEAVVDRNRKLLELLDRGELDLVLAIGSGTRSDASVLAMLPLVWIGTASPKIAWTPGEPIPLAVYEAPCFFRQRAQAALDKAGMPWRIAFTSPSLHGLWAAVEAGLGITLRTDLALPTTLRVLDNLPIIADPALSVCLHDGSRALAPMSASLRSIVAQTLTEKLPAERRTIRGVPESRPLCP
jgi:DNA-binding transcriptional LysR family regulator